MKKTLITIPMMVILALTLSCTPEVIEVPQDDVVKMDSAVTIEDKMYTALLRIETKLDNHIANTKN